jgi:hypothetical protein
VANSLVRKLAMKDARDLMGNLAQTNHYLVSFSSLKRTITNHLRLKFSINDVDNYLSRKAGILCSEASLPSSSLATGEVRDNFMGIPQEFAHTRLYTDLDFTFYVDNDYTNLRVFEGWMDYITSGSEYFDRANELDDNYYRRVMYPDDYKVQTMRIIKFERNYKQQLEYQFINAFPKLITAIPVSYGQSDILKVNVTFNYDRYIVNPKGNYRPGPTNFTSLTSFVQQQKAQSLNTENQRRSAIENTNRFYNQFPESQLRDWRLGDPILPLTENQRRSAIENTNRFYNQFPESQLRAPGPEDSILPPP